LHFAVRRVGILEEGAEIMEDYADSEALDAGLLAGGQAVEHYEMSRFEQRTTRGNDTAHAPNAGSSECLVSG
jgi:ferritin-like metal-binding protein YciE